MYILISARLGCATCTPYVSLRSKGRRSHGQQSEGTGVRTLSYRWRFGQGLSYSPTALLVRVQCFRNGMYKVVEWQNTRHIVLSTITWSNRRLRSRVIIFEPDEMNFAKSLTLLICILNHRRRPGEWFLVKHIRETIYYQIWTEIPSMSGRTSRTFPEACSICNAGL